MTVGHYSKVVSTLDTCTIFEGTCTHIHTLWFTYLLYFLRATMKIANEHFREFTARARSALSLAPGGMLRFSYSFYSFSLPSFFFYVAHVFHAHLFFVVLCTYLYIYIFIYIFTHTYTLNMHIIPFFYCF